MDKDDMTTKIPSVQKALNRLISEEFVAGMFYNCCLTAAPQPSNEAFDKLFSEIAVDELNDHLANLKRWAIMNDYDVPFTFKHYEKYAEEAVKQLNSIKRDKDFNYYINEALKSEQDAIKSYEEALKDDNIPYELYVIIQQNYYDELDHLESLNFLNYAFSAEALVAAY